MKKTSYSILAAAAMLALSSCSGEFLDRYPHGQWHEGNYVPADVPYSILIQGELANAHAYQHS